MVLEREDEDENEESNGDNQEAKEKYQIFNLEVFILLFCGDHICVPQCFK